MRVGFVVTRADVVGGAQVHVRDMALALRSREHEVVVIVGRRGPILDPLLEAGVRVCLLSSLRRDVHPIDDMRAVVELATLLKRSKLDVVSSHSSKAGIVTRLAARLVPVPCIFTAHGWAFTDGVDRAAATLYRVSERLAAPLADRIITVSDHDRGLALRYRIAPPNKLVTVRNGMPDSAQSLRASPGVGPAKLVMVARFERQKDHRTLLRSLAALRSEQWSLDLIGEGSLQVEAEELVRELGIDDRVTFLGARTDVAEQLAQASIFVLATNWEGLPRSIIEAMRAGLPVVATKVGGVEEAVSDGRTGFLVPRNDVTAMTDRLRRLIGDPVMRTDFGASSRDKYLRELTFDRMYDETVTVYGTVTGSVRPAEATA